MPGEDLAGHLADLMAETGWLRDPCMAGPTEDPASDLEVATGMQGELDAAIGHGPDGLGGMPDSAAHGAGGLGIETDADGEAAGAAPRERGTLAQGSGSGLFPWVFAFRGDTHGGETGDCAGVVEAEARLVVINGEAHLVAHEIDVALDGLGGDLELLGDFAAIGVPIFHEPLVEAEHAGEGWAGVAGAAIRVGGGTHSLPALFAPIGFQVILTASLLVILHPNSSFQRE